MDSQAGSVTVQTKNVAHQLAGLIILYVCGVVVRTLRDMVDAGCCILLTARSTQCQTLLPVCSECTATGIRVCNNLDMLSDPGFQTFRGHHKLVITRCNRNQIHVATRIMHGSFLPRAQGLSSALPSTMSYHCISKEV